MMAHRDGRNSRSQPRDIPRIRSIARTQADPEWAAQQGTRVSRDSPMASMPIIVLSLATFRESRVDFLEREAGNLQRLPSRCHSCNDANAASLDTQRACDELLDDGVRLAALGRRTDTNLERVLEPSRNAFPRGAGNDFQ